MCAHIDVRAADAKRGYLGIHVPFVQCAAEKLVPFMSQKKDLQLKKKSQHLFVEQILNGGSVMKSVVSAILTVCNVDVSVVGQSFGTF